jgi:hypothetical protein
MTKLFGILIFVLIASFIQVKAQSLLFNEFKESNQASISHDHKERGALNENFELSASCDDLVHLGQKSDITLYNHRG